MPVRELAFHYAPKHPYTAGLSEDERTPTLGQPLPLDPMGRAVARAKIAATLFARHQPVKLGRYHLLEQVGTGGMGVVWGAWDPELDRKVAIKIMKPMHEADAVVREGQALAKLSHPNVVPVYDVGVVEDQVFLVMEWVRGDNLRSWKPRDVRAIVRAFREAAQGLAAAHRAGLVHRDFKPENAVLGDDGRVRVLDFGIAIEIASEGGAVGGTPRYMAPEQTRGEAVTAASDQFAFGVALRDVLPAEPPGWLAAIIARATSEDQAARFPSMDAVIAALDRDPARVWRTRIAIAGVVAISAGAFAFGLRAAEPEQCNIEETVWTPESRATTRSHVEGLGAYGASVAPAVLDELDRYAEVLSTAHGDACRSNARGAISSTIYTATLGCLARARAGLDATIQVLATSSRERLPDAIVALRSLPDAARCVADESASTVAPPPAAIAPRVAAVTEQVARAKVRALALADDAIAVAAAAERAATELGYPALAGAASLVNGRALHLQGNRSAAIDAYDRATTAAFEAGDHATAIEAFARSLHAIASSTGERSPAAKRILDGRPIVDAIVRGLPAAFTRALYFNNLGTLAMADQDREAARRWFAAAARARPATTEPQFFELASIAGNRGLLEPDPAERDRLLASEVDELARTLGTDHPLALYARLKSAMFVEDHRRAAQIIDDTCRKYLALHPHLVERVGHCVYEQGWLAEERGDRADARAAFAAFPDSDLLERPLARGYLALLDGKPDAAGMRALAESYAARSDVWSKWRAVDAWIVVALSDPAGERAALEAALAAVDRLGEFAKTTFVKRRRGRILRRLVDLGDRDPVHLADARAWAALGGY